MHWCRLYVIHKCRKLKQLDFKKVKQKERDAAAAMFGAPATADGEAQKQTTFEPDEELAQAEAQAAAQQQVCSTVCCMSIYTLA